MIIQKIDVGRRQELHEFLSLPEKIYYNNPLWIPPLWEQEKRRFDPHKNHAFSYCEATLALAKRNGKSVGRIAGIINHRHNERTGEKTARFSCLECFEDREAFQALIEYVENWAREHGMTKIVGPMGFTDQDAEGLLIEGFEYEPTPATYYNFEYMVPFLEDYGYRKEVDYVVYQVPVPDRIPETYDRISERLSKRSGYTLIEFTKRKQLKSYIVPILSLMNDTFGDLYGYTPLDENEMKALAKEYFPILDPRFVKVIEKEGAVVAFILGIPNMNEGIRKAKGRLFPFGIFSIMRSAKKSRQLDLLLGAIRQQDRGRGLDVMLGTAMMRSARNGGFEVFDSNKELEENHLVRAEMERAGGRVYKRFRIYQKNLSSF